jgi:PAS domain S-box-containing protein
LYRILYVDDEPSQLDIGKLFLERRGHFSVDTITSAPAALALLDSKPYDAVISDYQMPAMDGIEFLKAIRSSGNTIPYILFTGRVREEVAVRALNEGADFYLQKGGESKSLFAELIHKIQIAIEHHQDIKKIHSLNRLYSVLSATNKAMVHLKTKSEFFPEICRILVETGEFHMAWIGLADPEKAVICPVASAGHVDGYLDTIHISTKDGPLSRGPTGTAYRNGKYFFSNDITRDPHMEPWRENALNHGYLANAAFPFAIGTKNAGVLTLYATVTGFFDEQIIGLLDELALDISFALKSIDEENDRKSAEEALRDHERRESDIINFLPDATFAIDRSGHIIAWNRALEEMTGLPAAEMLGKGDYEYAIPFYGQRQPILIDLIFESDEVIAKKYVHIIHKKDTLIADTTLSLQKGTPVTLMGVASLLYNSQGEIVGAIESVRDISERKKYEVALKASLDEKSVMLMEIHHRVKNNLQIITGLIRLQARQITNEQALAALRECETRVLTIALVHESLYQSGNLANINAKRHITNLASTILMSENGRENIMMDIDVDDLPLDMNTAIPASLIINELMTNSLKYAFSGRDRGTIRIGLHREPGNMLALTIADDGRGLPAGMDISKTLSLGLRLVMRLVQDQLSGDLRILPDKGTSFLIRFPAAPETAAATDAGKGRNITG